jgi:hypothetical protein
MNNFAEEMGSQGILVHLTEYFQSQDTDVLLAVIEYNEMEDIDDFISFKEV